MLSFRFDSVELTPDIPSFRLEIRAFLDRELAGRPAVARAHSWMLFDADFSRKLGAQGWIGLVWPKEFGGHERTAIERYVLLEELLAAGAPVGAHWIADRQSGPALLRYGTEEQKKSYLPAMARGETYCCIGMSEPNSGSDLASVRTRAAKVDGGWLINGQKIWTTHAHQCQLMIALIRTQEVNEDNRHKGLSQFLVELDNPGIDIRPIPDLVGEVHFNEVFFDNAFIPDGALLGTEGEGWKQVTSELSLERSGPERYLSCTQLFLELLKTVGPNPRDAMKGLIGRLAAEMWTLRQMSLSVAGQLAKKHDPAIEASIVKDLGNSFEQRLPELVQALFDGSEGLEDDGDFSRTLAFLLQSSPSFSLRGGTREILRGVIARGMGLR